MTDKNKPISSSNPPESRGERPDSTYEPIVEGGLEGGEEPKGKKVKSPTQKAPSPAKSTTDNKKE